uniref:Uncharacterized protein n=1 Tax=Arundo donax TaxID=35708 RepID=A0A0A8Y8G3_ARUDO
MLAWGLGDVRDSSFI